MPEPMGVVGQVAPANAIEQQPGQGKGDEDGERTPADTSAVGARPGRARAGGRGGAGSSMAAGRTSRAPSFPARTARSRPAARARPGSSAPSTSGERRPAVERRPRRRGSAPGLVPTPGSTARRPGGSPFGAMIGGVGNVGGEKQAEGEATEEQGRHGHSVPAKKSPTELVRLFHVSSRAGKLILPCAPCGEALHSTPPMPSQSSRPNEATVEISGTGLGVSVATFVGSKQSLQGPSLGPPRKLMGLTDPSPAGRALSPAVKTPELIVTPFCRPVN